MKSKYFLTWILIINSIICFAQNVGINTSSPNTTAALDIEATDKGLLFPRVSLDSVNGIITPILNPTESLLAWNTNPNALYSSGEGPYFFQNGVWTLLWESAGLDACYDRGGAGMGRLIIADAGSVHFNAGAGGINDSFVVSGKLAVGKTIEALDNVPTTTLGDGTINYFDPSKAAFRAGKVTGTQWDRANIGRHTTAFGLNNLALGNRTFVANHNNSVRQISSTSFGDSNNVNGESSYIFGTQNTTPSKRNLSNGSNNTLAGYDSMTAGTNLTTRVSNESVFGTFSKNYPKVDNTGGNDPGSGLLPVGTDSQWSNYNGDRIMAIGIGTGAGLEKNAFEIIKDGRVRINENYTLPLLDGSNDNLLTTNGTGTSTLSTPRIPATEVNVTNFSLISTDTNLVIPVKAAGNGYDPTFTTLNGGILPFQYSIYDFDGDGLVEIQILVNYTNRNGTTNIPPNFTQLQLVNSAGTALYANGGITVNTTSTMAYGTSWKTLSSADLNAIDTLSLQYRQARRNSDGSQSTLTIKDFSILVRDR